MHEEIFRLVNGAPLVGAESTSSRSEPEAVKDSPQAINSSGPLLDRGCKDEYYFGVGAKTFWVGRRITNF